MRVTLIWIACSTAMAAAPAKDAAKPQTPPPIDPATIAKLIIEPAEIVLDDPRAVRQILVTATVGDKLIDVTEQVKVVSGNPAIVTITNLIEARPVANGQTEIVVTLGRHSAKAMAKVANMTSGRPISFPNEIVPIFTKMTCNSGGCHGKSGGQNNFALSLLGFEPDRDYESLVKESRGRRLFPAAVEHSLLLRKATGQVPHGGGKLLKVGDDNYQLLAGWIRQGMPYGTEKDPVVKSIAVQPAGRVMGKIAVQRLAVLATWSDGRVADVTRHALFQSNDTDVARVEPTGRVESAGHSGESAVMARYMGQVAVFRATVPVGLPAGQASGFKPKNYIDELTAKKWFALGLVPSPAASDAQFMRRLSLDLCGKLPTPDRVMTFITSTDPEKRDKLIDELLASDDHAALLALKWGAILRNQRGSVPDNAVGTHAMSLWLKEAFYTDMPYDQFVRKILTATGTPEVSPPVVWFKGVRTPEENVDNVSQLFLGMRVQCARCHHHPFEKWAQRDYYQMASFFSRVGRKSNNKFVSGAENEAIFVTRSGSASHPKTGQSLVPAGLDGPAVEVPPGEDPRAKLVDWMVETKNPFFAKALVNRLWGHFFSRGLVEPVDDMRVTNPPSNPELLDALASDFVKNGYSVRSVIRAICRSATYQLGAEPNPHNKDDKQNFARYYPKRLSAETLLDALDQVTAAPTALGFPAEMRAVDLPDEAVGSYFLDIFGRPQRGSSCECERSNESNLSQALHLLNSSDIQGKLTSAAGRAARLAADKRPDNEKIAELFLWFFSRQPRSDELATAMEHITSSKDKAVAWQNLLWALLNTKEFQFNI